MNAKTNQQQVQQQQQFGSSVEVLVDTAADHHQPLFDYHRAHPLTDEPTLVRLDPYQQQQIYPPPPPAPNNHHHPAQHHPSVYLAPSSSISCNIQQQQQQQHRSSAFSSSNGSPSSVQQQQHGSTQRLDIRNLLLAPPAAVRNIRDGRGSVSAPATPVDDNSNSSSAGGLVIAASTVVTAAVPLNFNISSSSGSSTTTNCGSAAAASSASGNKNNSALGKFMMKKVNSYSSGVTMTGSAPSDCVLRDLIHPAHADALKAHSALAMKLLKTVSDFTQQLATIEEQHGEQLQQLVETFRIRNAELRKERPNGNYGLFQVWETLLQEVEVDSAVVADIANCLNRQVSRPMIDGTFHRKLEARKIFQHREQLENALEKASQQLDKSYQLYDEAYQQHLAAPNTLTLAAYVELHNNYVQDVHAANAMADQFHNVILPQLIQELESVYVDLSKIMTNTIQQGCEAMSERAEGSSSKRYNALANQCRTVNAGSDLATFVRSVAGGSGGGGGGSSVLTIPSSFNKFTFIPPRNPPPGSVSCSQHDIQDASLVLKDELVFDRLAGFSLRTKYESLKKDTAEVETHVRQLNECMESLTRLQQRSLESNSYNKASELQEEICAKKLEWRMAQLHLAAVKAQRDLYGSKAEMVMAEVAAASGGSHQSLQQLNSNRGSKFNLMASASGGSGGPGMKTKWMKAFRTLTNSSSSQNVSASGSTLSTTGSSPPSLGNSITPDQGSRLYQAVMAVIALRKSPSSSSSKSERHQREQRSNVSTSSTVAAGVSGAFHSTMSSSDLLQHHHLMQNQEGQRHVFQENTYKKITPCDVCSQVLRGHSRQGWKCRLCKINVHADCKSGVGRCLPKSRLLRRQKSNSELETSASQQRMPAVNYESQYQFQQQQQQQQQMQMQTGDDDTNNTGGGGDDGPLNFGREEIDQTYIVLKQASEMAISSSNISNRRIQQQQQQQQTVDQPSQQNISASDQSLGSSSTGAINRTSNVMRITTSSTQLQQQQQQPTGSSSSRRANPNSLSVGDSSSSFLSSSSAPHSPRRHQKLNLRMKSFSLDESGEHFHHHGSMSVGATMGHHSQGCGPPHGHHRLTHHRSSNPNAATTTTTSSSGTLNSNSAHNSQASFYCQSPSSPVHHNRRLLLSARNIRMNSVELPDENEKSQSSASASPCPSPKAQRLLPTNLYVVLFNFKGREADELDLKAGYKVTVIDASDPDWWRGKCLGQIGFFPSKYVAKLAPNEKPLQVTHNLQLGGNDDVAGADSDPNRLTKLLRDQIVIQIGEEQNGMVTVRNGDNKTGSCPTQYLQEV